MNDPIPLWLVGSVAVLGAFEVCDLPQAALTLVIVMVVVGVDAVIRGRRVTFR